MNGADCGVKGWEIDGFECGKGVWEGWMLEYVGQSSDSV